MIETMNERVTNAYVVIEYASSTIVSSTSASP